MNSELNQQDYDKAPEAPQKTFQGYDNLGFIVVNGKKRVFLS